MGIYCKKYVSNWKSFMVKQDNELAKKKELARSKKSEKSSKEKK